MLNLKLPIPLALVFALIFLVGTVLAGSNGVIAMCIPMSSAPSPTGHRLDGVSDSLLLPAHPDSRILMLRLPFPKFSIFRSSVRGRAPGNPGPALYFRPQPGKSRLLFRRQVDYNRENISGFARRPGRPRGDMDMKLLITGFEPFGGESVNPSYEAVVRLPDRIGEVELVKGRLPVSFARSGPVLEELVLRHQPDAVICVGQAGGYAAMALERVAVNLRDASMPDNLGNQPQDQPVVPGGPDAYFTTLPVKEMAAALHQAGIPAFVSYSAGTYVCNNVMYTLLDLIHRRCLPILGGFIHVPYTPEQAVGKAPSTPSMELDRMTRGLQTAIQALI